MDEFPITDTEFSLFRALIYDKVGIALSDAKRALLRSRLQKRLRFYHLTSFKQYYDIVMEQGSLGTEMVEMINCVTTNKTDFFREPHHFDYVRDQILPSLQQRAEHGEIPYKLRVWHAGCSTGEEPYTLAMVIREALGSAINRWDIRLLATDIDTNVLAHASAGIYDSERLDPVPEELRKRYFLSAKGNNGTFMKVKPELQQMITFKQINLLDESWPIHPSVRFDIIFCRNVVIYFDKVTQRKLFARYKDRLTDCGHMIIGHSESLLGIADEFENKGRTIYRVPTSSLSSLRKVA